MNGGANAGALAPSGGIRLTGPVRTTLVPPPFVSLPAERAQLEYSSRSIVYASDGDALLRAWGPPERPWVLSIAPGRTRWSIEAWGADARAARQAARELFSLGDPLEEFYRLLRREPVLRGSERTFRGLRLPRDAHLYESLVHAVVGQQLSVAAAHAIKRRLFERLGEPLLAGGIEVPCVPSPQRLLDAGEGPLRHAGLSGAKVRALRAIAEAAGSLGAAGTYRSAPLDRAVAELETLPGVGRWTAENVLLRGAGRRDVFVAGDLAIRVALDRYGAVRRSAPEAAARAWAEARYPGWGSYATLYLWRKLVEERNSPAAG